MPNGKGTIELEFDIQKMYGIPYEDLTPDQRQIVLFNMVYQACRRTRFVPWLEKVALAACIIIPSIIAALCWLFQMHMMF